MTTVKKVLVRTRRHARIRAKVAGDAARPRLAVYRSNRYILAQLIDDEKGATIAAVSTQSFTKGTKLAKAREAGATLARLAKEKKINHVVFDRGGFKYAGRIQALAEGAREGGLEF